MRSHCIIYLFFFFVFVARTSNARHLELLAKPNIASQGKDLGFVGTTRDEQMQMVKVKSEKSSKKQVSGLIGDEKVSTSSHVSWNLPGKRRAKHPTAGVYSDYPKPRTRPPTHN